MEQLVQFVMNHPVLVVAFLAIAGALVWSFVGIGGGASLGPVEATRLINHEDALVIDVRTPVEFERGHIVGALNIPVDDLEARLEQIEKRVRKGGGRPVLVVCQNGQRSRRAAAILRKHGLERVFVLGGGMTAWQGASLPVVRED